MCISYQIITRILLPSVLLLVGCSSIKQTTESDEVPVTKSSEHPTDMKSSAGLPVLDEKSETDFEMNNQLPVVMNPAPKFEKSERAYKLLKGKIYNICIDEMSVNSLATIGFLRGLQKNGILIDHIQSKGTAHFIEDAFYLKKKISYIEWKLHQWLDGEVPFEISSWNQLSQLLDGQISKENSRKLKNERDDKSDWSRCNENKKMFSMDEQLPSTPTTAYTEIWISVNKSINKSKAKGNPRIIINKFDNGGKVIKVQFPMLEEIADLGLEDHFSAGEAWFNSVIKIVK